MIALKNSKKIISVVPAKSTDSVNGFDAIYVHDLPEKNVSQIYSAIRALPKLLITKDVSNKQITMINLMRSKDGNRIVFEVNVANMLMRGLSPKDDIVVNGGSETDIASLYKDAIKKLSDAQNKLIDIDAKYYQKESELKAKIEALSRTLEMEAAEANNMRIEIAKKNNELLELDKERVLLISQIEDKNRTISNKESELEKILKEIEQKKGDLIEISERLISQEKTINAQSGEISSLDGELSKKINIIQSLLIIAVLFFLLIVNITINHRRKNSLNKEILERNLEAEKMRNSLAAEKILSANALREMDNELSLLVRNIKNPIEKILGYSQILMDSMEDKTDQNKNDISKVISLSMQSKKIIDDAIKDAEKIKHDLFNGVVSVSMTDVIAGALSLFEKNSNKDVIKISFDEIAMKSECLIDAEKAISILAFIIEPMISKASGMDIEIFVKIYDESAFIVINDIDGVYANIHDRINSGNKIFPIVTTKEGDIDRLIKAKNIVISMGGSINIQEENDGCAIAIRIPIVSASKDLVAVSNSNHLSSKDDECHKSVVYIGEEISNGKEICDSLKKHHIQHIMTGNTEEAINSILTNKPSVISINLDLEARFAWEIISKIFEINANRESLILIALRGGDRDKLAIEMADEIIMGYVDTDEYVGKIVQLSER